VARKKGEEKKNFYRIVDAGKKGILRTDVVHGERKRAAREGRGDLCSWKQNLATTKNPARERGGSTAGGRKVVISFSRGGGLVYTDWEGVVGTTLVFRLDAVRGKGNEV